VYFVFMYENRTMQPAEIDLRRGGIYKCHNVSLLYNYNMLIKKGLFFRS
jgi:hypothetical protein